MSQKLGQHFLINKSAAKKIVAALNLQPNDTVIEIGPGKGALTFPLAEACQKLNCKIIAIEKDQQLAISLELLVFKENLKIEIIKADALKSILELTKIYKLKAKSFKIVGNIPYYITGKLLRILSELENKPELTVLMIQKEVAERIIAEPPRMNLLAAAVQFWAEPKIILTLKPADFNPAPKVHSAIIQLIPKPKSSKLTAKSYYNFLHILFKQPRKTILNNLKSGLKMPKNEIETALKSLGINPTNRPQNLSLSQIKELIGVIKL